MLAYIGLGSNLNNPKQQIRDALIALNDTQDVKVVALSSLYQSKPIDNSKQPDYINAVCEVDTHLSALELLYVCQDIETKQHRVREKKWGARTIDLDIITYGVQVIASKQLIVPHPEMMNRSFVLVPLAEIEPDFKVPVLGSIQALIDKLDTSELIKL
ncbi:2-amino-4-hydroxy-6-hydroxymethyldihydropteridinepyrophosphokinase (EC [uncultured Gammaproteobacteria bacterium]|jgi:2-amino-4-hydroxy-6-hydroxymethyldihydropteridine diphosphokinase|uniref:2-amino-4-hydroxy-6- hydroxymethyldihydropteridine diphosphokinase n=1 Tax=thiotrophic endosymbiont of Bathymodiolus puteoserpentis (Logatchev) TaxID=343240 RepID=UPI0010B92A9D|nr:2-amino-4-hydroxy-6-hydroxymethyldihydropteridine diphosphokinase [thiotrophic endosymbiont of Bathymodiolus puteoserpentis (Logatchev)]CAC9487954.1 2-amino-4-hydroxy-6-hydroxymethyldihydropteridine pyrophosphokinase (EC 2.7.6.3) [uncultured Gammaproteobacteria bacterium]CAC9635708.1 2-amino-4-hydroxy-6-hydroxymethyldihydropteridine pyrophosphokinase (EC 2.7.6.3) [uncultured Gammaproteobacteria bacterium]SSC10356.1 2-amino-4-hydroxy-6-hydroxymethyldihydropteridinepyrophosphokinase [thiotrophi